MKNKVKLDIAEQNKIERELEKQLKMFKSGFDYLMNHYKFFKLPASMFNDSQVEYLKATYQIKTSKCGLWYYITSKSETDVKIYS